MPCKKSRFNSSAPAKIILFGEHAVVYGIPAIAAPIPSLRAYASAERTDQPLSIRSLELDESIAIDSPEPSESALPMQRLLRLASEYFGLSNPKGILAIRSDIPIAGGLGSGAAVSAAAIRALASLFGREITNDELNRLIFEVEKIHHGTPSGIDNTVVVYERPVYYRKGNELRFLTFGQPCHFVIADTGRASMTREAVNLVRQGYDKRGSETEAIFQKISSVVVDALSALERGMHSQVGGLMSENHLLLQQLGVSSNELDQLVDVSVTAGAMGAKLSGGGLGGNMIALVDASGVEAVKRALVLAGALKVIDFELR